MKLYRGLKEKGTLPYSPAVHDGIWEYYKKILQRRAQGDFSYPTELDGKIRSLRNIGRLSYQHFSDNEQIAQTYAKQSNGVVIEVDVPLADIHEYFTIEFQNFAKRKEKFEIVYIVRGLDLYRHSKRWKMKIKTL